MKIVDIKNRKDIPILYSFRRCPYAIRARSAIYFSEKIVEIREISLKQKPTEMISISKKATVPVLKGKNFVLEESLDIMFWALDKNDKYNLLSPFSNNKNYFYELVNKFDIKFKHHLDRYKYSSNYNDDKDFLGKYEHREKGKKFLILLNNLLCNGRYLFNNKLSLLDISIFPLVRQFKIADPEWFKLDKDIYNVNNWLDSLLSSIFFKKVMYKYDIWNKNDTKVLFHKKS